MTGFKTLAASIAMMILGLLETFDVTNILGYIPDQYDGLVVSAIGIIVAILRFYTKTPILKSE